MTVSGDLTSTENEKINKVRERIFADHDRLLALRTVVHPAFTNQTLLDALENHSSIYTLDLIRQSLGNEICLVISRMFARPKKEDKDHADQSLILLVALCQDLAANDPSSESTAAKDSAVKFAKSETLKRIRVFRSKRLAHNLIKCKDEKHLRDKNDAGFDYEELFVASGEALSICEAVIRTHLNCMMSPAREIQESLWRDNACHFWSRVAKQSIGGTEKPDGL